jgi:uncharacterized protein with PQ loop repeat
MFDWIGWLATAVFASSYLSRQQVIMRRIQGLAALMWSVYGGLIHALPVLVANLIVAAMAIGSSFMRPAAAELREPAA